jgi:hypothetical protein
MQNVACIQDSVTIPEKKLVISEALGGRWQNNLNGEGGKRSKFWGEF